MIAFEALSPMLELLRKHGVAEIKMDGLELRFAFDKPPEAIAPDPVAPDAPIEAGEPIKHKIEELTNVMKLSDEDLVERLFPMPNESEESQ